MPKVNLYATFRDLVGKSQLVVPGSTVGEVLSHLVGAYPALKGELFAGEDLAERVSVFLEGRDVRYLQGLSTPLSPEATLDLFPPVAGGGFERTFGAFPPWLLERYLEEWGGTREGEGVYRLPGAGCASGRWSLKGGKPRHPPASGGGGGRGGGSLV